MLGDRAAREIGTFVPKTKGQSPQEIVGKYVVVWQKEGNDWKLATDIRMPDGRWRGSQGAWHPARLDHLRGLEGSQRRHGPPHGLHAKEAVREVGGGGALV
jgi:hypothetical protein